VPEEDNLKTPQPPPAHITTVTPKKRWILLAEINRHLVCNVKPANETLKQTKRRKIELPDDQLETKLQ
jgi:hypothetical protein